MADQARSMVERWEWIAMAAVLALDLVLARRTFEPGFFADNDFITHVAWTQYLVEEHWPATHAVFGWNPHHGTGLPFLLYNTPPGLVLAAASLCLIPGIGPVAAVKGVLLLGWLATPVLAFGLARSFVGAPRSFPVLAAVFVSLFSSELFGLEFFFKNGMANAAIGVPLILGVWWALRAGLRGALRQARWPLLVGGGLYAVLLTTHVTSAYMAAIGVIAIAIAGPRERVNERLARASTVGLVGLVASAWWWWPSLGLMDHPPAAFTWIRAPRATLMAIVDGSLWSSYPAGFYARFIERSHVGITVTVAGAIGAVEAVRRRSEVAALAVVAALALWFTLGPSVAGPLTGAPLYENLLWYRFATLLSLTVLLLAAYGAATVVESPVRGLRLASQRVLLLCLVAALAVVAGRSSAVLVSSDFPEQSAEFDALTEWLREHPQQPGRIYSEFPRDLDDAISVNHARHMLPHATGLDEAAVWVYENNDAGQHLMARGLLWDNPRPMLWLAERYDVRTIVAYTPAFQHALDVDPRWSLGWTSGQTAVYQAQGGEPSLVHASDGAKLVSRDEGPRPGGGYAYRLTVDTASERLIVKVNHSRFWRAHVDGQHVELGPTPDGLIELTLPPGPPRREVQLEWSMQAQQRQGWMGSLFGGLVLLIGVGVAKGERLLPAAVPDRVLPLLLGAGAVALGVRGIIGDRSPIHTGLRDGMQVTRSLDRLDVGAFADDNNGQLLFVLPHAWSEPALDDGVASRRPLESSMALVGSVPSTAEATLTIEGRLLIPKANPNVRLYDAVSGDLLCDFPLVLGTSMPLPRDCASRAPKVERMPGLALGIGFSEPEALVIRGVQLHSGTVTVHGESLRNHLDDSGADARYFVGLDDVYAHNGALLTVAVGRTSSPVTVGRPVPLEAGQRYELWALMVCASPDLASMRALARFALDGVEVGRTDGVGVHADVDGLAPRWVHIGTAAGGADSELEVQFTADSNSWADLDAVAFVPTTR